MTRRACPLCRSREHEGLDYHHWTYAPPRGVELCRQCHDQLHDDGDARPSRNTDWLETAIRNLVELDAEHHGRRRTTSEVMERYGIPESRGILVSMALDDRFPGRVPA